MDTNKRQRFGWVMYDWANSAYITTVAVAVLPAYFAQAVVPEGGYPLWGATLSATTLWSYTVSLTALLLLLVAPVMGAVADSSALKKRFLAVFCYGGSLATVCLLFSGPGRVWYTLLVFVLAQTCFVGGNVFYNAFLPHLAKGRDLDTLSGKGFAFGYMGGGLQFALCLGLISLHKSLGLGLDQASRIAMASAGVWWGGFAVLTFRGLHEPPAAGPGNGTVPQGSGAVSMGIRNVLRHTRAIVADKPLLFFLLAFVFYNDGIQTVIYMATIYGKEELGFSTSVLMLALLLIQAIGILGALAFARLAGKTSTRTSLFATLVLWSGVAVYGYILSKPWEYFILAGVVGLILGGSQALSRSFYAAMIPKENAAEYFGYFSVVQRFSSILGPLVFGLVSQAMGSARPAVLSIIVFFIAGMVFLAFVKPRKEAA